MKKNKKKIEKAKKEMNKERECKLTDKEKEKKNFYCAICQDLLCEPVKLDCDHYYCKKCILRYVDSMQSFEAGKLEKKEKIKKVQEIKCPLCKQDVKLDISKLKSDKKLLEKINEKFKDDYKDRKKEEVKEKKNTLTLLIGNFHNEYKAKKVGTKVGKCTHEWGVFVKLKKTKIKKLKSIKIKKVQFELHKDFGIGKINVYRAPWEVKRKGWGTFPVKIWVYFERSVRRKPVFIEHELSFDKTGKYRKVDVDLSQKT